MNPTSVESVTTKAIIILQLINTQYQAMHDYNLDSKLGSQIISTAHYPANNDDLNGDRGDCQAPHGAPLYSKSPQYWSSTKK
jgi:hypothetical protein